MDNLPIDPIILKKRIAIPELIAKLTYHNESKAIEYMRIWGEKRMTITKLYDLLEKEFEEDTRRNIKSEDVRGIFF